ncbi:hypothetical protein NQ315_008764 [Exocentrus adspersus]|uniref:Reverse transcriptase domain-containing protein n=1 Tax=Exocentrus adspersus TaxID=1586481 RepID=A0AAV8VHB9_9CUCU|nr:hypothetical protein NQ315_008764 [Exocentrus adspersus]
MPSEMRIIQLNCNRVEAAMDLCIQTALEAKADLICVSEPNKGKCRERRWIADEDRDAAINLINIKKGITSKGTGKGFVCVKMAGKYIYSCYLSPNAAEERAAQFFEDLEGDIRIKGAASIILTGDFNGRSGVWGGRLDDERGARILEWVARNGLVIQNRGNEPTCLRPNGDSRVDLTVTSADIGNSVREWKVTEEATLSDHKAIAFSIYEKDSTVRIDPEERWRFRGRKSEKMVERVGEIAQWLKEQEVEIIIENIRRICREVAPGRRHWETRKEVYWWNGELAEMRRECVRCRREWSKKKRRSNEGDQGTAVALSELEEDPWGRAYTIAVKKLRLAGPEKLEAETETDVLSQLFPQHRPVRWAEYTNEGIEDISEEELRAAMGRIKTGKAPGPDGLTAEIWMAIAKRHPDVMISMYNKLLREGMCPAQWKKARGKSTIDAIQTVVDVARTAKEGSWRTREWCSVVLLDVKNAFNSVSWQRIHDEMVKWALPQYIMKTLGSYFENRKIRGTAGSELEVSSGVPQGSCLGPLIWNIQYDDLCALPLSEGVTLVVYADDVCVVSSAREEEQLIRKTNEAMDSIAGWMRGAELELALQKTEAVMIKGRRQWRGGQMQIAGVPVEIGREAKYLGVWVDSSLGFKKHITEAGKRAEKSVNALSRLMPNVGGPGMAKRKIMGAAAQSIMLYGAEVWAPALETDSYRRILETVQRRILLRVVAAYKTVSERSDRWKYGIDKKEARQATMRQWQRRWESGEDGAWTRRLIKDVKKWATRSHGEVGYRLTQWMTGHGSFGAYRRRIGKSEEAECYHCDRDQDDTPEHTLFRCPAFLGRRDRVERDLRRVVHVDDIVEVMLESERNWRVIAEWVEQVMKAKEEEEWRKEGRPPPIPVIVTVIEKKKEERYVIRLGVGTDVGRSLKEYLTVIPDSFLLEEGRRRKKKRYQPQDVNGQITTGALIVERRENRTSPRQIRLTASCIDCDNM